MKTNAVQMQRQNQKDRDRVKKERGQQDIGKEQKCIVRDKKRDGEREKDKKRERESVIETERQ